MRERINKPRVFLSHARKDVEFIERIERDLRRCQIEPWRDINEIRDGEPWQNVIFAEGIPACDVVITYYTENSIASQMVSKEVDSALLRQLSDNGIGFLPYVNSDETRNNLRLDIQALQCRVWNTDNYDEVLPSVVAEIWRRYTERAIPLAVSLERSKRLELELELKNLQSQMGDSAFYPQEEKEFQYIFERLSAPFAAFCKVILEKGGQKADASINVETFEYSFVIPPIWFLVKTVSNGENYPSWYISTYLTDTLKRIGDFSNIDSITELSDYNRQYTTRFDDKLYIRLENFGLAEQVASDDSATPVRRLMNRGRRYTEKMHRFVYWLEYNNKAVNEPAKVIDFTLKESN